MKTQAEIIAGGKVLIEAAHESGHHAVFIIMDASRKITSISSCSSDVGIQMGVELLYQIKKREEVSKPE